MRQRAAASLLYQSKYAEAAFRNLLKLIFLKIVGRILAFYNMGKSFDYCWVVFDKDDYQDFDESISYAENNGFNVAYSNESFELWFLLHFSLFVNPVARGNYARLLSKYLGIPYTKQSGFAKKLYQILKPLESKAIKNAETLMVGHNGMKPSEANPSTTVHKLVSSLNEYVD